ARAVTPLRTVEMTESATAFVATGGRLRIRPEVAEIPWPGEPAHHFRTQFEGPTSFWLDAENSDHTAARYSVMGGTSDDVHLTYDVARKQLTMSGPIGTRTVAGDLFALIGDLLEAISVDSDELPADIPYRGGLVGYLGYELKALCGGTSAHTSSTPDASLLWPARFVVLDHHEHRAWSVATVPAPRGATRSESSTALRNTSARASSADYRPGPVDAGALDLRDDRTTYLWNIREASRLIRNGESYEVCLTNRATLPAPHDRLAAYERMRAASPVPYGAYLRLGDITVLSSSPELFLDIAASREVSSAPIKGTRPRGCSPREDEHLRHELAASVKDRAENLMIVDLVRHDLNAVCEPGSVHVPEPFMIQSFRSVHQMVSVVRGRLREGVRSVEAIRSCFPPGSMVGAPKIRTMEIIDRLENEARGVYSGAIGWLDASGAVRLNVVIRTAVLRDDEARVGIGGAITALSDPEDEFTEILVKASVPHHALVGAPAVRPERKVAP
ncbi:aminodeoxychorismate synthase component I, partial [Nocardia sp. 004]|uniref:aminodeoxychorismate synthase component I n=1 Tax=Nocardia sp. 004 TaxID=3385978 RepID=UPI0039A231F3